MAIDQRDPSLLDPGFRLSVDLARAACSRRGIEMRAFFCVRDLESQARLWRQSRSRSEIENGGTKSTRVGLKHLRAAGCNYIADAIESVGPCSGPWRTNAFPGNSWHQWALAEDDYWLVNGSAIWSSRKKVNGLNGYKVWAEEAARVGLRSLGKMGDWPHVQGPAESAPSRLYSLPQIDAAMRKRFGG